MEEPKVVTPIKEDRQFLIWVILTFIAGVVLTLIVLYQFNDSIQFIQTECTTQLQNSCTLTNQIINLTWIQQDMLHNCYPNVTFPAKLNLISCG